jgi:hypothetical protein
MSGVAKNQQQQHTHTHTDTHTHTHTHKKIMYAPILILFGGNVVCLLVRITCVRCFCLKGLVFYLFRNKIISLQQATLGAGLQNRTPTMSGALSWYEMSEYVVLIFCPLQSD